MKRTKFLTRASAAVIVATLMGGISTTTPAAARGGPRTTRITCGQTITQSIRVANDLTCEGPAPVLTVMGPGVTVDLNGRVLAQTIANPCHLTAFPWLQCGVEVFDGATLTNGTLRTTLGLEGGGTARRIRTDHAVSLNSGTFDRGRITDALVTGTGVELTRSHLERSTIVFDDTFTNLSFTIRDNVIEDSDASPAYQGTPGGAIQILATYLFLREVNGEIVGNRIVDSAEHGIVYEGGGPNVGDLLIAGNDLRGNGGDGISVTARPWPFPIDAGGPLTVQGNRSMANRGYGIEIDAEVVEVVDAGGNVARSNRLDPQCIGVVCRGR